MGLRKLRLALLCATFLYPAAPARAEPISTAIGLTAVISSTLAVSTLTAGAIGGVIVSGAISVGATLISQQLRSNPDGEAGPQTPIGVQGQMTIGAVTPRNRIFGKMPTAGALSYWRKHADNLQLQLVFTLASGPHEFFGIIDDGLGVTLEELGTDFYGINERKWAANGVHTAYVRFHHGYYDQDADADLIAASDPAQPWTEDDRGRGVCYVTVNLILIPDVYPNGLPNFQFIIGARTYDRRKDSTAGGAGAHRWNDEHTWEFNENPSVGLYEFERGLTIGDVPVMGRHLAPVDLLSEYFVGSSNICDEGVGIPGGGTEPRYRVGMNVGCDRDLVSVERDFCMAMAGDLIESVGAYGPLAGVAQAAAMTIYDTDFLDGSEVSYSPKRSRSELVNAVFGAYTDPNQNFQPVSYSPRFSLDDEAADSGRFVVQRDVLMIPSETQAQRVIEILRRAERLQAIGGGTLKHKFSPLESGDWVRWISARNDFDKHFKIANHQVGDDRTIAVALKEISVDVYGEPEYLDPLNPASLPGFATPITTVSDFALFAVQISGDGDLTIPALHCEWSPILDLTVDAVKVEYRVGTDDSTMKTSPPFDPQNGEGNITDGIQAGTPYQARAIITTTPVRTVYWTDWELITAPPLHTVPKALTADAADEVLASGILGQIISAQIADAAITAAKIAAAAVTATAFAAGIEPVGIAPTSLPNPSGYVGPKLVFLVSDGKVYRYAGGAWTPNVATADLTGSITGAQIASAAITSSHIAAAAVTATAFAAGIEPIGIVSSLPNPSGYTGLKEVHNTTDGKNYRYFAGAWTAAVPTADLTGQVATSQIADAAIISTKLAAAAVTAAAIATAAVDATKFAAGIEPVSIVASLPSAGGYAGPKNVFNIGDGKTYRYTSGAFTASVPTTDLTGQITTTQITDNSVTTVKVAANAITAAKIAANTITANEIAANTLTAGTIAAGAIGTTQLAANAVTATIIAAGAVTTAKLAVGNSSNVLFNSDARAGTIGYVVGVNTTGLTPSVTLAAPANAPPGMAAIQVAHTGTPANGTQTELNFYKPSTAAVQERYPVITGDRYELSAYSSSTPGTVSIQLKWYNAAGANFNNSASASVAAATGTGDLSGWPRVSVLATAPAGAVSVIPVFTVVHNGSANPSFLVTGTYLAPARPNQTELSPWAPSGTTVIDGAQIVTDTVTASQIAASAITTTELAANAVTAAKVAANTLTAGTIAAGAIGTTQLAASAVTAGILAAGAVTTAKLAVAVSSNMLFNSDLNAGRTGHVVGYAGVTLDTNIWDETGTWSPMGMAAGHIHTPTAINTQYTEVELKCPKVGGGFSYYPVIPGQRYEFSAHLLTFGPSSGNVVLQFWDYGFTSFIQQDVGALASGSNLRSKNDGANYDRYGVIATAPAGARWCKPIIKHSYTGTGDAWMWWSACYFAPASANQTDFSPWTPSGATVIDGGGIVADSITATQVAASAITTSELAANAVTAGKVQAAAISTTQLAAGGVTTSILAAGSVTTAIIAANAVDATKVVTSSLVTLSAQINSALINTLHLVGASVSVADAGTVGAYTPGGWLDVLTLTLTFNDTINGTKIPIMVMATVSSQHTTGLGTEWEITVNSARIFYDFEAGGGRTSYPAAGTYLTGTGGTVTGTVKLRSSGQAGGLNHIIGSVMTAVGYKR